MVSFECPVSPPICLICRCHCRFGASSLRIFPTAQSAAAFMATGLDMATGDYQWSRLPDNQIRLLTLKWGAGDDALHFDLTKHLLDDLPPYEALSYAWGDGERDKTCYCQDEISSRDFKVTDNLFQALKQLRYVDEDRILWVDQICINQTDKEEKTQQIRLMTSIYRQAKVVVVWLGPADSDTLLAFSLIYKLAGRCAGHYLGLSPEEHHVVYQQSNPPLELKSADSPEWVAYRRLLKRPWFGRLWVFQELALSRVAFIVCGEFSMSWPAFMLGLNSLGQFNRQQTSIDPYVKEEDRLCNELSTCNYALNNHEHSKKTRKTHLKLFVLVAICMSQQTSEPSDKVYGLLGLAQDIDRHTFPINYDQHFRDTYMHASRLFIEQYGDLNVLKLIVLEDPLINIPRYGPRALPSWVPDFRHGFAGRNGAKFSSSVARHGKDRYYNASGASRATLLKDEYGRLTLSGLHVGNVVSTSEEDGNTTEDIIVGRNVLPGGQWSQLAESSAVDGTYLPTGEPIALAFQRLCIRDYLPTEVFPEFRTKRLGMPFVIPEPGTSFTVSLGLSGGICTIKAGNIASYIVDATTDRRLVVTDSGYIGLVQRSCVVGDSIFILMGSDMPCVLRKLETGTYAFQGEAYVHGIMDGEYLLKRFSSPRPEVSSELDDQEWLDSLSVDPLPFDTERVVLS